MSVTSISLGREGAGPLLELVRFQLAARALEELMERWWRAGRIPRFDPPGRARTAQVGAAMGLEKDDVIVGGRRDFPAAIARGHRFRSILRAAVEGAPLGGESAELVGRGTGRASVAVGRALAARLTGVDRVVLSFFGTAAVRDGSALGAIRAARDVQAPVIFVARGPLAGDPPLTHIDAALGVTVNVMLADDGTELRRAVVNARLRVVGGDGPVVLDARFGESPAVARDTQRLQSAGQLSAEFERAVNDEIRSALWEARNLVEGGPS